MVEKFEPQIFMKNIRTLYNISERSGTEAHLAVIQAIYNSLQYIRKDLYLAELEMCLTTATGIWLDYWGSFFGYPREDGEPDREYAVRIIEEIKHPKATIPALKSYGARYLNKVHKTTRFKEDDIKIFEPWTVVMKPSQRGTLSGDCHLWSPDYYTGGVITISLHEPSALSKEFVKLITRVKAAGVKIDWRNYNYDCSKLVQGYEDQQALQVEGETTHTVLSQPIIRGVRTKPYVEDYYAPEPLTPRWDDMVSGQKQLWVQVKSTNPQSASYVKVPLRRYLNSWVSSLDSITKLIEQEWENTIIGDGVDEDEFHKDFINYHLQFPEHLQMRTGVETVLQASLKLVNDVVTNTRYFDLMENSLVDKFVVSDSKVGRELKLSGYGKKYPEQVSCLLELQTTSYTSITQPEVFAYKEKLRPSGVVAYASVTLNPFGNVITSKADQPVKFANDRMVLNSSILTEVSGEEDRLTPHDFLSGNRIFVELHQFGIRDKMVHLHKPGMPYERSRTRVEEAKLSGTEMLSGANSTSWFADHRNEEVPKVKVARGMASHHSYKLNMLPLQMVKFSYGEVKAFDVETTFSSTANIRRTFCATAGNTPFGADKDKVSGYETPILVRIKRYDATGE